MLHATSLVKRTPLTVSELDSAPDLAAQSMENMLQTHIALAVWLASVHTWWADLTRMSDD
jgi:hypothetical protein